MKNLSRNEELKLLIRLRNEENPELRAIGNAAYWANALIKRHNLIKSISRIVCAIFLSGIAIALTSCGKLPSQNHVTNLRTPGQSTSLHKFEIVIQGTGLTVVGAIFCSPANGIEINPGLVVVQPGGLSYTLYCDAANLQAARVSGPANVSMQVNVYKDGVWQDGQTLTIAGDVWAWNL